ncbi:hypothetical protein ACHMXB_22185 (plasmid) [Arthrobacter sp. UC242_113]|uniref:hypothetical protein n=1 Tax=Arthrobacter sp. UC242_113 TaxID=3374550 RepID=UPI0037567969
MSARALSRLPLIGGLFKFINVPMGIFMALLATSAPLRDAGHIAIVIADNGNGSINVLSQNPGPTHKVNLLKTGLQG